MHLTRIIPLLLSAANFFCTTGRAQPTQSWVETYNNGGPWFLGPAGIVTDASGDVYIVGTTRPSSANADMLTVKYNASGVLQWAVTYNGPGNNDDEASAITIDRSGNVYVTGTSVYLSSNGSGMVLSTIKYSSAGVQLWATNSQIGAVSSSPSAITVDGSDNVYITGNEVNTPFAYDFLTIKLNPAGTQQWAVTYNGTANTLDWANAIAVDAAGNVYITGQSKGELVRRRVHGGNITYKTGWDFVTIKYNPAGVALWIDRYNGPANTDDIPTSLVLDASANVYVTGARGASALTIAYSTTGTKLWTAVNTAATTNTSIAVDPGGNIVTGGYDHSTANGSVVWFITKYTAAGTPSWVFAYPGNSYPNVAISPHTPLAIDEQANIYTSVVVGTTANPHTANFNFVTLKISPAGVQTWAVTYNGPADAADIPTAITITKPRLITASSQPTVYVTGLTNVSSNNNSAANYSTIKYLQPSVVLPPVAF
jgi:hypothetical protein